ncbi:unnamed protein product [Brassica oleracea var. botrytis]
MTSSTIEFRSDPGADPYRISPAPPSPGSDDLCDDDDVEEDDWYMTCSIAKWRRRDREESGDFRVSFIQCNVGIKKSSFDVCRYDSEKKEAKGDETPSVEIGTVHDDKPQGSSMAPPSIKRSSFLVGRNDSEKKETPSVDDDSDDFEEHLHGYVVDVGSDDGGVDIGVPRDFGEYHHDDVEAVHTLVVHAPSEVDQGPPPRHDEEPGPSQRRPIGDYMDMFHMIHTRYPGLMSSLCLPEDDLLTFDQKRLRQIMGLIKAEGDRAEREMEMIVVQEIGDQVPEAGGRKQIEDRKLKPFKEVVVTIIHEYFSSSDVPELIRSIEDLGAPEYKAIFVKMLVTLALDRKNREKEMASVLISSLHIEMFATEDVADGFFMLLESAEDTALDPSYVLALFLARTMIDDVLSPVNLVHIGSRLQPNSSGAETVKLARLLIFAGRADAVETLLLRWGGGTGWGVKDTKDKIVNLLEEYESSGMVSEACKCIHELGMPFFNHELVKKALIMAMEKKKDKMVLDLFTESFGGGLITINQMTKGFSRVKDGLQNLALDIPNAKKKFNDYVKCAKMNGWVSSSFPTM